MSVNVADYVIYQMCTSLDCHSAAIGGYQQTGLFDERQWPRCTCPAYKFTKRTINFGGMMVAPPCKHIEAAKEQACGWHQAYSEECQEQDDICPRCGGPTIGQRWAV
jgi:hypothetical protein